MKILKGMRKKKLPVKIFLTCVFLAAAVCYIHKTDLRTDMSLSLSVKASRRDNCRLFIDNDKPLKEKVQRYFRQVSFDLPKRDIKNIRLMLGEKPGKFVIKAITVKSPFKRLEWSGEMLKRIFKFSERKPRERNRIKNGSLHIQLPGGGSILSFKEDVSAVINDLSRRKSLFYLVALLLSLAFFYFIHFLGLKNLRIFLTKKIVLNMALIFMMIICFPIIDDLFNITKDVRVNRLQEKRVKARPPGFRFDSLFRFLKYYQRYYNDNFGLRDLLIPVNNYVRVKAFALSPIPSVMVGKEGWLYLAKQNERIDEIEYYRSLTLFSLEELREWKEGLEKRRDWLARRGSHYLFVIAANKSTIYPEFLPDSIRPVRKQSRLDQLLDYLEKNSDIRVLDLRPVMFAAKKERRVYRKTDSHWNRYGAYLAYREIMKALSGFFKYARPLDISNFNIYVKERSGGDLAIMLSLQNSIYRDKVIEVDPKIPRYAKEGAPLQKKYPGVSQSVIVSDRGTLPNAIMIHDSFANRLKPFLSEHFSRVVYLRDWGLNFYADLIKREQPAIVIEEMAERFLLNKILSPPPAE
ncbi:MAG: hypothetical protein KAT34_05955 [Candidatus Aminicenantes bacterium]|nr:hypothetical protein [Candidatus Aminicenantes bacterium]